MKSTPWSIGLKTVSPPLGPAKQLTLIVPYYQCKIFFELQCKHWWSMPSHLMDHVSIIVVDDGSPEPAIKPNLEHLGIRLFRIEVDCPWNWLAARNIGAHYASDGWLLLTDMDHVVPEPTMRSVIYGQHDPRVVYGFSRREHTGEPVNPHSASFLMTKTMFWNIGGYDERLSGVYGTDGSFRKRVADVAPIQILADELVRHEYVKDSSVSTYERKTERMRELRRKRFASVPPGSRPKVLSFAHHEVAV